MALESYQRHDVYSFVLTMACDNNYEARFFIAKSIKSIFMLSPDDKKVDIFQVQFLNWWLNECIVITLNDDWILRNDKKKRSVIIIDISVQEIVEHEHFRLHDINV